MFTNEFKFNNSITTVLDDEGSLEDVQLTIGDDMVYIKQYNNDSTFSYVSNYENSKNGLRSNSTAHLAILSYVMRNIMHQCKYILFISLLLLIMLLLIL